MKTIFVGFRQLHKARYLLAMWAMREIKVRYKQSFFGGAWAVLQPFGLMLIFTLVFSVVINVPSDGFPYPVFAYVALVPWTFFNTAIAFGIPSLINNANLVTKIHFPREILPLGSVLAGLVDYGLGLAILLLMMVWYRLPFNINMLWLPLLLAVQTVLMLSVILFLGALNVFYRDIRFVIPLLLQIWMYATPIIYPLDLVPDWLRPIYMLNPMVAIIDGNRRIFLRNQMPDLPALAVACLVSVTLFLFAYWYFKQVEWKFADLI